MYEDFLNRNRNKDCVKQTIDDAFLTEYIDKAPKELLALWQEVGLGCFDNGLFRIINPADYTDYVYNYIEDRESQFEYLIPFMTSAFGDIFAWVKDIRQNEEYSIFINERKGYWNLITTDISLLFAHYIRIKSYLEHYFAIKDSDYLSLVKRLGTPKIDECFGYVPALALGGSKSLKNIQIVKMASYIELIAQAIGTFDLKVG